MMMRGTIKGARNVAKTSPPQRVLERASASAARPARRVAQIAVAIATPKERNVAASQTGEEKYVSNHCRLYPGAGNSRNCELVNPIGITSRVGSTRNTRAIVQ